MHETVRGEKNAENGRTNRDWIKDVKGTYFETFCSMSSMLLFSFFFSILFTRIFGGR